MRIPIAIRYGVAIVAVLAIGLLAGILIGTGMDHYAARSLPERGWVEWRQVNGWVFPRIMPYIFNGTALALIVAAIMTRKTARLCFAVAALCCFVTIFITVKLEIPMNHAISSWTPGASPPEWMDIRQQWLRNHLVRTVAGMLGFLFAAIGLARWNAIAKPPFERRALN
jgi:hypothetical protein